MTNSRLRGAIAALLIGTALAAPVAAQTNGPAPQVLAERLKTLYPATRFGEVSATPWPGVFEVLMGANLAYVDATGQFFLFGHLYDMQAQRDLTAQRKDAIVRIDFAALPLQDALKEVRGSGARTLVVFSDPDCPHCRRLEAEIAKLNDVTLYTFLLPIASLHPEARGKAIAVWCAGNRTVAWQALMREGKAPPARDCPHPVDRTVALAERLGINGTPTLVAADGRMLAGAASLAQIEAWLGRGSASAEGPQGDTGAAVRSGAR
jgi:thiol:disulfide interchange protein DsbC